MGFTAGCRRAERSDTGHEACLLGLADQARTELESLFSQASHAGRPAAARMSVMKNGLAASRSAHSELALGGGSAFGVVEFGFDVGDVAFGEVVEELPGAVFLFHLWKNGFD